MKGAVPALETAHNIATRALMEMKSFALMLFHPPVLD
jgi:hypothetical protein